MRLFIAIDIPDNIKEYITKIQGKIETTSNKIRFVDKNNIHLTLKFLGEVEPYKTEEIKAILKKISFKPFYVCMDKIGVFPSERYIRVIWVSLKPENDILELQKNIDDNLKKLFKKEKDFKAHLTLARVKFIDDKNNFIGKLKKINIEEKRFGVENFKLVKSTLTGEGPVYEDLEVYI